jgi:hypothetical protein
MSKRELAKLPLHIYSMLKVYETASNVMMKTYSNASVKNFLHKTSDGYTSFQNYKLLRSNTVNTGDFAYIVGDSIGLIFETPLKLGHLESLKTQELFNVKTPSTDFPDSIASSYRRTAKQLTDFEANIIKTLGSHYNPKRSVPRVESIQNSYKWYTKLLQQTPVFFVLRKHNRLYSESFLLQIDKPYTDFKQKVATLGNTFRHAKEETAVRNYHFTNLTTTDLFKLAIKDKTPETPTQPPTKDKLIELLDAKDEITFTNTSMDEITEQEVINYTNEQPLSSILSRLSESEINQVFPYDLNFTNYYLLCIEDDVLQNNHDELFDAIEDSEFELIAGRFSLLNPHINDFFHRDLPAKSGTKNYSQMLEMAQNKPDDHINDIMKRVGGFGLVSVEQGLDETSIYLLPKD